jgi:hypothetical protein
LHPAPAAVSLQRPLLLLLPLNRPLVELLPMPKLLERACSALNLLLLLVVAVTSTEDGAKNESLLA